jgi:hypothetical protein
MNNFLPVDVVSSVDFNKSLESRISGIGVGICIFETFGGRNESGSKLGRTVRVQDDLVHAAGGLRLDKAVLIARHLNN